MQTAPKKFGRFTFLSTRVVIVGLCGGGVYLCSGRLEQVMRILLAYDLGVAVFLALQMHLVWHVDADDTRELAENKVTSNTPVLVLAVLFSAVSLAGVGVLLDNSRDWTPLMVRAHMGLSLLAIFLSWILLHTMYGFYYARLYYQKVEDARERGWRKGLIFPEGEQPDYVDFLYYSFTIAMCYQTSDVTIVSRQMRRITLVHALLSFLFVTGILGLVINVISNLV